MQSTTSQSEQPVKFALPFHHMFSEERDSGFCPAAPDQAGRELREAASRFDFGRSPPGASPDARFLRLGAQAHGLL